MSRFNAANSTQINIDARHPGPVINKNIYGQFAEHLGRLFYGGLWVGPIRIFPTPGVGAMMFSLRSRASRCRCYAGPVVAFPMNTVGVMVLAHLGSARFV